MDVAFAWPTGITVLHYGRVIADGTPRTSAPTRRGLPGRVRDLSR